MILTVLSPEKAKIYCEGLDDVVEALKAGKETKISEKASSHKLKGGQSFYRSSRDSKEGQGFSFLTGIFAGACGRVGVSGRWPGAVGGCRRSLDFLFQATTADLENFLRNNHAHNNKKRNVVG